MSDLTLGNQEKLYSWFTRSWLGSMVGSIFLLSFLWIYYCYWPQYYKYFKRLFTQSNVKIHAKPWVTWLASEFCTSKELSLGQKMLYCAVFVWVSLWFKSLLPNGMFWKVQWKGPLPGLSCKRVRTTWQADHGSCITLLSCRSPKATVDPNHNPRPV